MVDFNNTWRKRLACKRCRQLKVRCEYYSPTNDTCIRCQKSNTPCIIPAPKRKDGAEFNESNGSNLTHGSSMELDSGKHLSQDNKDEHALYLRRIIRDAEQKLAEMDVSPLRQAFAAGVYTVEEANRLYASLRFQPTVFPAVILLNLPQDIVELDKSWPWLAISIVTAMSLNYTGKSFGDMQLFIQDLYKIGNESQSYMASLDKQLGYAFICQYGLSFHERGLSALLQLHALTISTMTMLRRAGKYQLELIASHVAVSTILPYTLIPQFESLGQICSYYDPIVNSRHDGETMLPDLQMSCEYPENADSLATVQIFTAGAFVEAMMSFRRASKDMLAAATLDEITRIMEVGIQSLDLLANHTLLINVEFSKRHGHDPSSLPNKVPTSENLLLSPLQASFLVAKMTLLKRAASKILDLRICADESQCTQLLFHIVSQAAEYGGRLFRAFAHVDSARPLVRTTVFYHVSNALLIMQMLRFTSFACGVGSDVRSDCLLQVVTMKWEEMLRSSMLVRQLYLLLFKPLDLSNVKIGLYDAKTDTVIGSGNIPKFDIIYYDGCTRKLQSTEPFTRQKLLDIIEAETRKSELGTSNPNWSENADSPSLSTVIHLLICS